MQTHLLDVSRHALTCEIPRFPKTCPREKRISGATRKYHSCASWCICHATRGSKRIALERILHTALIGTTRADALLDPLDFRHDRCKQGHGQDRQPVPPPQEREAKAHSMARLERRPSRNRPTRSEREVKARSRSAPRRAERNDDHGAAEGWRGYHVPEPILSTPPSPDIVAVLVDEQITGLSCEELDRLPRKLDAGEDLGDEPADRVRRVRGILDLAHRRRLKNLHLGSPLS